MTYPNYVWISHGWYFETFWIGHYQNRSYEAFSHCTTQQLMNIVKGMFMVNTYPELDEMDSQVMIGDLVSPITFNWLFFVVSSADLYLAGNNLTRPYI